MAAVRPRETKTRGTVYDVDYYDETGRRRLITCRTKGEAMRLAGEKERRPGSNPRMQVATLVDKWLLTVAPKVKPRTVKAYRTFADKHFLPELGRVPVVRLTRRRLKELAAEKLERGASRAAVVRWLKLMSGLLQVGFEEGVLLANPARGLASQFRGPRQDKPPKALTREELDRLLEAAAVLSAELRTFVLLLARTGLRIGEALALQWGDFDFGRRVVHVERKVFCGEIDAPKGGRSRDVDLSLGLVEALRAHEVLSKEKRLRSGWKESPPWVFTGARGGRRDYRQAVHEFRRAREAAELPAHVTPHSLRHSFACHHLQRGTSPAYVQKQLGHASIKLTVDLYGSWLPLSNLAAADALD